MADVANDYHRKRFDSLTGIRYFAASLVLFHHLFPVYDTPLFKNFLHTAGDGAVSLFFVLSGFVLFYSNVDAEGHLSKTYREFYVARIARIYPLYIFAFILISPNVVWYALEHHPGIASWGIRISGYAFLVLSMTQAWFSPLANAWNGPAWSLSVEAFFYITFPIIVKFINRFDKGLLWLLFGCWIASSIPPFLIPYLSNYTKNAFYFLTFFPLIRIPEFISGIILYKFMKSFTFRNSGLLVFTLFLVLCIGLVFIGSFSPDVFYRLLSLPIIVAIIFVLALPCKILNTIMGNKVLIYLGASSYALYILHIPLIGYYMTLTGRNFFEGTYLGRLDVCVYAAFATIASVALHWLIERPAASLINKKYGGIGNASKEADRSWFPKP